jgi:hypothetical protein
MDCLLCVSSSQNYVQWQKSFEYFKLTSTTSHDTIGLFLHLIFSHPVDSSAARLQGPSEKANPRKVANCLPSCWLCNNHKGGLLPEEVHHVPQERIVWLRLYLEQRGREQKEGESDPVVQEMHAMPQENKGVYMSEKDIQSWKKKLPGGKQIKISCGGTQIILQLRQMVASEDDPLTTSLQVAVALTPAECVTFALELLRAASPQLEGMQQAIANHPDVESIKKSW